MFPHYLEVAGWLALAVVTLAWLAMAVFVTFDLIGREVASRSRRQRLALIWLVPIVGVALHLLAIRRDAR